MPLLTKEKSGWFQRWVRRVKRLLNVPPAGHTPAELAIDADEWAVIKHKLKLALQADQEKAKPMTNSEQAIVDQIRAALLHANRNNVKRTRAYWDLAVRCPELHWALLAHVVSRNGGWNMTDLQGEWLPKLMSQEERLHFFRFLETANAYIFQDAYPQLLLYIESRKAGEPYFHLLPHFHVSRFMRPFWESFWRTGHSPLLTLALIVNEQHYIEGRIVQHPYFRQYVLDSALFKAQSLLQLNQVLIPHEAIPAPTSASEKRLSLCGVVVETFSSLEERIQVGKALYGLLYHPSVLEGVRRFATQQRHTGSRADYWPHLFSTIRPGSRPLDGKTKLNGCKLQNPGDPVYSPALTHVWPDQVLVEPARYDWFRDTNAFRYIRSPIAPSYDEMSDEYCFALKKIEAAAMLT
ncbi:DUF2515 family protein [Xylanibacillus composti]|uniref:DUF2515 domain-containing protein n=1 Tax=Xylanibacillus composti TaxID=1572762 RepID=A0A8J4H2N1_9BACL|nr:DUF2515 family protein [Xylanibacillus composti]GIQ68446.1 hypothetical protein XYCOK13_12700 [Xylanibacillus composti]